MQARTLLGLSCYGAKRFVEAAKYLGPAAKADPANSELHQVLAQSCLWAKNYPCAQEQFSQILQHNPDSAAAHMLLGQALDGLQRPQEAIAEFETAAKVAPQEPGVHFGLGYLHWKLRQYDDAKAELELELAADPNHAQALAYLGDIEMKRNNPEQALVLLRKAAELRNDIRLAHLDMGGILAQQKHLPEAIAALQHAERLDPLQPDAHLRLGRLYQASGNTAAAQKEFAKLRELHQKADEDIASKMSGAPPPAHQ
jgi:tetratricopeptide (TPR) repeat protein